MSWQKHPSRRSKNPTPHAARLECLRRSEGRCAACGATGSGKTSGGTSGDESSLPFNVAGGHLEVDHIDATIEGPSAHRQSNLQALCVKCHATKTKVDAKAGQQRRRQAGLRPRRPGPTWEN